MNQTEIFRQIPSMNELVESLGNTPAVKAAIEQVLKNTRAQIQNGKITQVNIADLKIMITKKIKENSANSLQPVINATGIILHTNLGRSVLSKCVKEKLNDISFNYSNLEFSLNEKKRGSRYEHVESILKELTGTESALVVNNNAAAVLLILSTIAHKKEVVVSRGELVEIGGSFRIPDIITSVNSTLREVGTTNKTHLADYQSAINEQTGAILKVHPSNYEIIGFTEQVPESELVELAHQANLPLITDLGSGLMVNLPDINDEPTVREIAQFSDLVAFSGDKLLGGPQAGIIVGKSKYIDQLKHHQLLRALRIDKLTLAALEATLQIYQEPARALKEIPTLRMLTRTKNELQSSAEYFLAQLQQLPDIKSEIIAGYSEVGGGTFPNLELPTSIVAVSSPKISTQDFDTRLRQATIPIITRLKNEQLLFDLRTLTQTDLSVIIEELTKIFKKSENHE